MWALGLVPLERSLVPLGPSTGRSFRRSLHIPLYLYVRSVGRSVHLGLGLSGHLNGTRNLVPAFIAWTGLAWEINV